MNEILGSKVLVKLSFIIDAWSSRTLRCYFAIIVYLIDIDWNMQSLMLEFVRFESPHDGYNVCSLIKDCIEHWGISDEVMAVFWNNGSEMCRGLHLLQ